jgi:hypothetical protein
MFYCTLNNVCCSIIAIGQDTITIDANGYTYNTTLDNLIALF